MRATWKPHEKHGELTARGDLPTSVFAYPKERKEPMTDASHVRNAVARFDQVTSVSDDERELAFANIKKAAKHYGVALSEDEWTALGRRPSTGRTSADRKRSARAAATTRKKASSTRKKASTTRKKTSTTRKKVSTTRKKAAPARKKAATKKAGAKKTGGKKTTREDTTRKKTTRKKS